MNSQVVLFWGLAAIAVLSGLMVVVHRNPVRSALFLVLNMVTLALVYLTLSAQFVAAVQTIVYAGAIMVLFLFVIMLLNLGGASAMKERGGVPAAVAVPLAVVLGVLLVKGAHLVSGLGASAATAQTLASGGTVQAVGKALYDPAGPWLFPFELTSVLLLVGVVGAVALAKRKE